MNHKKILLAIGGNSLIKDKEHLTVEDQYSAICQTAGRICDIIQRGNRALITHGNGPQVGFILRRSEIAQEVAHMHAVPLVSCDADTQGAIGYQIQQALDNEFRRRDMDTQAVTLITQVEVASDDPAFRNPAKPIGRFYNSEEYKVISELNPQWTMMEDAGRGFRRVVPSPFPQRIVELKAIQSLYDLNYTLIAAGGGGIPVINRDGQLKGVDAVIDKDRASALLAVELQADIFIISTGVRHVCTGFNTPEQKELHRVSIQEIKEHLKAGEFAPGSMAPKIEAALFYLERGGKEVIITDPENLSDACFNGSGTHITNG